MLSVKETADQLDISTSSVRRAADQHRLLCSRVNGERRFRPEDVTAFSARRDQGEIDDERTSEDEGEVETQAESVRTPEHVSHSIGNVSDPAVRDAQTRLQLERFELARIEAESQRIAAEHELHLQRRTHRIDLLLSRLGRGDSARDLHIVAGVRRAVAALDAEQLADDTAALASMREAEVVAGEEFDEWVETEREEQDTERHRQRRIDGIVAPIAPSLRALGWPEDVISAAQQATRGVLVGLEADDLDYRGAHVAREEVDRVLAMVQPRPATPAPMQMMPPPMQLIPPPWWPAT